MPPPPDLPPSDVAELLALLEATRALACAPAEPGSRHMAVLAALKAAGRRGMTQVQLAAALGIAPTRMSRLIDLLEPQGIVCRENHPLDRRSKIIQLTESGQQKLALFETNDCKRNVEMFSRLPPRDITSLKDLLSRVISIWSAPGDGTRNAVR